MVARGHFFGEVGTGHRANTLNTFDKRFFIGAFGVDNDATHGPFVSKVTNERACVDITKTGNAFTFEVFV